MFQSNKTKGLHFCMNTEIGKLLYKKITGLLTRVYGITQSVFARRWGGEGFDSRTKPRQS